MSDWQTPGGGQQGAGQQGAGQQGAGQQGAGQQGAWQGQPGGPPRFSAPPPPAPGPGRPPAVVRRPARVR
ncbi:hypothetical protein QP157_11535 [Sphingomonas sp. LR61]|uniref:hypothetical protein n=1 Tax=Sphingomonas sp. LR61 TaxID=3050234 RepID=UPI002FE2BDF5